MDNGISAVDEAALAKELGIELVITDHHQPGDVLPYAAAVVDPHRNDDLSPFKDLCGCGVALKLIAAMDGGSLDSALEQFSDLAAIATVADVVPLTGENREIVRLGLKYLENTENAGLQALMEAASVKLPVTSAQAAFALAPRINATGRFASASEAVELLLCEDPDTAAEMAARLNSLNSERKKTEAAIMEEIRGGILKNPSILHERVLFLYGEGWPLSQRQLRRERCFTKADYIEFASLRDGLLSRYRPIRELTFAGKPFVPPKAYRRMHRERSTPAR